LATEGTEFTEDSEGEEREEGEKVRESGKTFLKNVPARREV